MKPILGNITAILRYKTGEYVLNSIGERVPEVKDLITLTGYLDMTSNDAKYTLHNAKIQESDHLFICDYVAIPHKTNELTLVCNGKDYDVLLVDDPMEMHKHLEIYLRYVGE